MLLIPSFQGRGFPYRGALQVPPQNGTYPRGSPQWTVLVGDTGRSWRVYTQVLVGVLAGCVWVHCVQTGRRLQPGAVGLHRRGDGLPQDLLLGEKLVFGQSVLELGQELLEGRVDEEKTATSLDPHSHVLGNATAVQ